MGECSPVGNAQCLSGVEELWNELKTTSSVPNVLAAVAHTSLGNHMTLYFQPVEARGVEYSWNDAVVFSREGLRAHTTGAWVFSSCLITGE